MNNRITRAHHIIVRKFFISSITKGEMKSGFTGEKGERDRGGRLVRAFLQCTPDTMAMKGFGGGGGGAR